MLWSVSRISPFEATGSLHSLTAHTRVSSSVASLSRVAATAALLSLIFTPRMPRLPGEAEADSTALHRRASHRRYPHTHRAHKRNQASIQRSRGCHVICGSLSLLTAAAAINCRRAGAEEEAKAPVIFPTVNNLRMPLRRSSLQFDRQPMPHPDSVELPAGVTPFQFLLRLRNVSCRFDYSGKSMDCQGALSIAAGARAGCSSSMLRCELL